jgi:hypothetical protein
MGIATDVLSSLLVLNSTESFYGLLLVIPFFPVGAYCLYKSVRSLAPFSTTLETPAGNAGKVVSGALL